MTLHLLHLRPFARLALGAYGLAQAAGTWLADGNRTHATHPAWTGHARFHLVWQAFSVTLFALLQVFLLAFGPATGAVFLLAWCMAAAPCFGFLLARLARRAYGGTMSDPQGIPPWSVGPRKADGNTVMVWAGLLTLATVAVLYRCGDARW